MDILQVPLRFTCSYQDRRVLRTLEASELPRLLSRGIRSCSDLGGDSRRQVPVACFTRSEEMLDGPSTGSASLHL